MYSECERFHLALTVHPLVLECISCCFSSLRSFGARLANTEVFQYYRHKVNLERVSTMCCESNYGGALMFCGQIKCGVCRSQWMFVITAKANQQSVFKSPMST